MVPFYHSAPMNDAPRKKASIAIGSVTPMKISSMPEKKKRSS
jgi:hypothetical protein